MSDPTRILYIHHAFGISGATLSLLFLIQRLDRTRYTPTVLCLYDGPAAQCYREAGVPTITGRHIDHFDHSLLAWYSLRRVDVLARKLATFYPSVVNTERVVREIGVDIVHLNASVLPASAIGAKRAGVPVVWHIREPIHPGYIGLRQMILRKIIDSCADRAIAICQDNARQLIPSERTQVIYNFVDFDKFDRRIVTTTPLIGADSTEPAHIVLMLGGVAIPKGTEPFVQALPLVLSKLPNTHFVIAGPVPEALPGWQGRVSRLQSYHRRIQRFIEDHHLEQHVHFLGVRRDIPQLLAACDLLAFPSVMPHFARPIIEAGAMAKPVVASNLGGPDELVVDGETGILVPHSDPTTLAKALIEILSQPTLGRAMGESGYARARSLYDAQQNAEQTFAVYDELLGARPASLTATHLKGIADGN
ncbi:MAG: glycosyltransferase family 4 protein [Chloroflexi bacterium]|nr:glycosyltransferase family 4 protein [Chloroflexota bacterium]